MSPIDYPDLLADASTNVQDEGRGRKSSATRFMSSLRSRSRSRGSSSMQRRSASAQPAERRSSSTTKEKSKRRRSLSRHGRSEKKNDEDKKAADILDLSKSLMKKKRSKSKDKDKKKKSKSTSPSRRKSASEAEIINLVDTDENDLLLSHLLTEDTPKVSKKKASSVKLTSRSAPSSPNKKAPTAKHNNNSPRSVEHFTRNRRSEESSMSEDDNDDSDSDSITATDLLDKVHARMEQQKLMEDLKKARREIEKKNHEIEQLTGQLRMAISTKCDLVIAHTELERIHEMDMQQKDAFADELKKNTLRNLEIRAEMEIEYMNELDSLAKQVKDAERRRTNEVLEKDMEVAQLQERVRRLEQNAAGFSSVRPEDEKVRFYKKRLGLHDQ